MFIAPVSLPEYLLVQALSGIFKALCIFIPASFAANSLFGVNVYSLGAINLVFFLLNLILFAISLGIIILGLIFRFGTRIQAFAWGLLPIFQPLTAAFYPVSVLPGVLPVIAYALPPTYIFEAIRASTAHAQVQWQFIGMSFLINSIYLIFSLWFFNKMFNKSKEKGQFARLEG
ncbi:MAG TPA: ABC transporter permease [Methylomirabilota bacterium]|nr:ABC transporter permease [Methylomirabilota bacterium]